MLVLTVVVAVVVLASFELPQAARVSTATSSTGSLSTGRG
jgi:hypothetical protein